MSDEWTHLPDLPPPLLEGSDRSVDVLASDGRRIDFAFAHYKEDGTLDWWELRNTPKYPFTNVTKWKPLVETSKWGVRTS